MLQIIVPATEEYNEKTNEFSMSKESVLQLEHSLVSLAKWESKWKKPFLKSEKTIEETVDYIRCMTITQNVGLDCYKYISQANIDAVNDYINDSMTATTFRKENQATSKEIVTAEIIYYWMITYDIPFECQKWHLNRLLTLINVCYLKNKPSKKMSSKDIAAQNREINAARRARLHTSG